MSVITNSIEHDAVFSRGNRGSYGAGRASWSRKDDIAGLHDEPGIINELRPDRLPFRDVPIADLEGMRISEPLIVSDVQDELNSMMLTQLSGLLQAFRR